MNILLQIQTTPVVVDSLTGDVITPAGARGEVSISLMEMIMKGGPIMIPLGLLLVLTLYIFIERMLVYAKIKPLKDGFVSSLKEYIAKGDIKGAVQLCEAQQSPEAMMLAQGVRRVGQPLQEIRTAMQQAGLYEISLLERNLSVLLITGRIAPIFGFIGTIVGVIKIFYDISLAKTVEIEVISTGLYQKMMASAAGLVVGLLAFVFYHWLNSKVDKMVQHQEKIQMQFLDILSEP
ncbi:MAG: MotA/TolQ/ExbB proton channel family protein [Bacteroidia bacterium]|nr:MotA/TolQ/ExbB proton channel family protein [Bacteroidia bacterium]